MIVSHRCIRQLLPAGVVFLAASAVQLQAMAYDRDQSASHAVFQSSRLADRAGERLLLADARKSGGGRGPSSKSQRSAEQSEPRSDRSAPAEAAVNAESPGRSQGKDAGSRKSGRSESASAGMTDGNEGTAEGATATDGHSDAGDGSVQAESSAAAGLVSESVPEASALSGGAATVAAGEGQSVAEADSFAETGVMLEGGAADVSRTKSFNKEIDTRYGAISMSRETTVTVLDDGTKVRTVARARAMALDTPGVSKAKVKSAAKARVLGQPAADDGAVSDVNRDPASNGLTSPAISPSNLD